MLNIRQRVTTEVTPTLLRFPFQIENFLSLLPVRAGLKNKTFPQSVKTTVGLVKSAKSKRHFPSKLKQIYQLQIYLEQVSHLEGQV